MALGQNPIVAYMTWEGYNFEDAVIMSERLVKDDVYTSVHLEEYESETRDTKLGPEEITREIPNVGEDALKDLDEMGIIRIGAEVKEGDILVGKVTPKGEKDLSAEERLLHAIFGDKSREVRDTSLRVPHGADGVVRDVKIFTRVNGDELQSGVNMLVRVYIAQKRKIKVGDKMAGRHGNKGVTLPTRISVRLWSFTLVWQLVLLVFTLRHQSLMEQVLKIFGQLLKKQVWIAMPKRTNMLTPDCNSSPFTRVNGDELQSGVNMLVRVYIAQKRKIKVGDKMAGRHGNKGVVSRIVPVEDMPYLPDGTPVDIMLNPLGVPSRMNIGQVMELHLGMAARTLGIHIATPVFDGASSEDLWSTVKEAGMDSDAKTILYDGRTGEPFDNRVSVGVMYMIKLHHMVDDKLHARSVGPYSTVTQQPLGGKAQFGGQRFGEMEVWALEAYGASNVLQEILTYKSDDINGRLKAYEAITKGKPIPKPGVPESFRVLVKELQSLGLDMRVLDEDDQEVELRDLDEGMDEDVIHVDDLEKAREKAAQEAKAAFEAEEAEKATKAEATEEAAEQE
ncbi:DNA-directed RNA polymerase subunit beta [Streptococcus pneumoniae]|nr:DNA-directed RNA polymerase subunit beta [Streptococcus pneumoniae]